MERLRSCGFARRPLLGISISALYQLANAWLNTGGQSGMPAVRLGRRILIPRAAIDRLAAVGSDNGRATNLAG
jgi:hypothetical protein